MDLIARRVIGIHLSKDTMQYHVVMRQTDSGASFQSLETPTGLMSPSRSFLWGFTRIRMSLIIISVKIQGNFRYLEKSTLFLKLRAVTSQRLFGRCAVRPGALPSGKVDRFRFPGRDPNDSNI
jgi:hypothetical protein